MAAPVEASVSIEEGGMSFPLVRTFWVGDASRALGAGTRYKKIAFVGVKVRATCPEVSAAHRFGFYLLLVPLCAWTCMESPQHCIVRCRRFRANTRCRSVAMDSMAGIRRRAVCGGRAGCQGAGGAPAWWIF